jgi:ribonuclease G
MIVEVFINKAPGETRLALVEDGRLVEYLNHRVGAGSRVGAVYLGRVQRRAPELGGVFVDIGDERPGLLPRSTASEGDAVVVRVRRDASDDKGPQLVADTTDPGTARAPALLVPASDPVATFLKERVQPGWRVVTDDALGTRVPLFAEHDIETQLEAALQPTAPFGDGGTLIIEETAALTAIDVNSGARGGPLATNLGAVPEIARQLRLRNLGGQIFVDFLPLKARDQNARVLAALRSAVKSDPGGIHVLGLTKLGLAELTRRRVGESLAARLGIRSAWRRSAETGALDLLRVLDEQARFGGARKFAPMVSPQIDGLLNGNLKDTLAELGRRHALVLDLRVDPTLPPGDYRL